ncbi:LexA family transcriptional regulator [uncultured Thiomicrorhabdus sp.]
MNEIIKKRARELGIKQIEIARATGATRGTVNKWFSGLTKPEEYLNELCALLKLDPVALKNCKTVYTDDENYLRMDYNVSPIKISKEVPLIDYVAAGDWTDTIDAYPVGEGYETRVCPVKHSDSTFALKIQGESMLPKFQHGEVIFCDPQQRAENSDYVIAKLSNDQQATFKQLVIDGNTRMLKALNPNWPTQYMAINGDCHIVGKVIARIEEL